MSLKLSRTVLYALLIATGMIPSVTAFSQTETEPAAAGIETPAPASSPHKVIEQGGLVETNDLSDYDGLKARIGRCATTDERSNRLICYDTISQRLGLAPAKKSSPHKKTDLIEEIDFWKISEKRAATGELMTYARLDSNNTIMSKNGAESNVTLSLRCEPGKTDVMIDWKSVISDRIQDPKSKTENPQILIAFQIDGGEKISQYWDVSLDKHAIFAPYPVEFVRKIIDTRLLSVVVAPPGAPAVALSFDTKGARAVSDIIVERCYKPSSTPAAKTAQ